MPLFDLPKNQNSANTNKTITYRMWLALLNDVDIDNFPIPVMATISTNVLLANKTYNFLDCKANSIVPSVAVGESPDNGVLTVTILVEGLSKQSLTWLYENKGKDFVIIWERCQDKQKFIAGSPCSSGVKLTLTNIGEIDGGMSGLSFSFVGGECPEPFWFYDGPIPRETPQIVNLGAGTTFALGTASQYMMTDNTAAKVLSDITNVTDADVGRIIELIGAGVNFPTQIQSSAKFIMNNGLSFSCAVGNSISFQITKTETNAYAFYEVYR